LVIPSPSLQTGAASFVNLQGGSVPQLGGIANIQNLIGGPGSANALIGPDVASTWTITGADSGTVGTVTFSNFQNLTGRAGADTFVFQPGGSVSGSGDGGGSNTLDYSHYLGNITVDLALNRASLVNGGRTAASSTSPRSSAVSATTCWSATPIRRS
jgi:hypothetical protein